MSDPHEPAALPPDVASLLASERAREPADDARVERLLARFEVARDVRDEAPPREPAATSPLRAGWRRDVALLTLGAALGAGAHAVIARRPPPAVVTRTVRVPQVIERVVTVPAPAPAPTAPADAGAPAPVEGAPRRGHGAPRDDADGALAAERAALEIARTALSRGQAQAALDALSRYEHHHRGGALGEERASLWVIALARAGRTGEARERAASFRRRWPESYLLPAVEAVLE